MATRTRGFSRAASIESGANRVDATVVSFFWVPTAMNILIVGNGGREHAIAWKIVQSDRADRVFVAPGNAGTAADAENVDIPPSDIAT